MPPHGEQSAGGSVEPSDLCRRLRVLRIRHFGPRGKRRFANALGLPLSTYCTYEATRDAPASVLAKAAEVTGCDLRWLLTGAGEADVRDSLPAEDAGIITRLGKLLAGKPEARHAMEALADLLSEAPESDGTPDNTGDCGPERPVAVSGDRILPIIGRTAAGRIAFWEDAAPAGVTELKALADEALQGDLASGCSGAVTSAGPPYRPAGRAEIVRFSETKEMGKALLEGVIALTATTLAGDLVAVEIDGESMEEIFKTGDYVIVDTQSPPASGEIALVTVEGQIGSTCKIYLAEGSEVRLIPANPAFQTFATTADKITYAWRAVGAVRFGR